MGDFCEEDYEVLKCRYCGADMMASEYEISKRVQLGAKDLGIIDFVLLYGSCPECLAVKTSYLGIFGYRASGYKKIHEYANAIWGDVLLGCSWALCNGIVALEKIRSDITEKKLFVRVKCKEC